MFNWGKKDENVVEVSKNLREYEIVATVSYLDNHIFHRIQLEILYRLKGADTYKCYKAVVVSESTTSHSNFIEKGNDFMDKFEENVIKHAKVAVKNDNETLSQLKDIADLKNRILHRLPYETTIKV